MTPEPICIDLTDGSSLSALAHVESGKLHINLGWLGTFVIEPESARAVCRRLLDMLGPDRCLSVHPEVGAWCTREKGHKSAHVGYGKAFGPVTWA